MEAMTWVRLHGRSRFLWKSWRNQPSANRSPPPLPLGLSHQSHLAILTAERATCSHLPEMPEQITLFLYTTNDNKEMKTAILNHHHHHHLLLPLLLHAFYLFSSYFFSISSPSSSPSSSQGPLGYAYWSKKSPSRKAKLSAPVLSATLARE